MLGDELDPTKLTDADIERAYENLSEDDKDWILGLSIQLEMSYKQKWASDGHIARPHFGPKSAFELLCKLGIFILKNDRPWILEYLAREVQKAEPEADQSELIMADEMGIV